MNTPEPAIERKVAGFLITAKQALRSLLVPEAESLVTLLGHVEAAFECTAEPSQRDSVEYHCRQALRIIEAIERRHDRDLPEPVTHCLDSVRRDVEHAMRRIDPGSSSP